MGKNVQIVLTVDASRLYHMKNPSQDDIHDNCELSDDNDGVSDTGKIVDFLSNVYIAQNVEWVGESKDVGYNIAIDSIVYDFDLNDPTDIYFLDDDITITGSGGKNSKVVATVKDQADIAETNNIYKINFSIYYQNNVKKYLIDPKLRANS
ncbi:hypothetical protein [Flavobacterium sp. LC2016-01]|uniref:hypothetical protein n=1 Tax=Flavobacterium sp. LC2016-01 TaxID=2675876 RepID=UPI0012BAF1FD|nr:hypothetical protein [Flavobacterium sp. LC2016-01]MTH14426.1 hypothetical protein [Flavobacterium sp. LC2016-01]